MTVLIFNPEYKYEMTEYGDQGMQYRESDNSKEADPGVDWVDPPETDPGFSK